MGFTCVGINHKTTNLNIREKFYLNISEREILLSYFNNDPRIIEAIIISTCNRTEIYANLLEKNPVILLKALFKVKNISFEPALIEHFYIFQGSEAIKHILSVTAGLDSLIIGEKQILGQMKEAIAFSAERNLLGKDFNILSNIILETGKKVRRETTIDFGGSSISWAAVMAASQILGSLKEHNVLVLGSGKMGRLAIDQINQKGVKNLYLMNRTLEKAQEIAQEQQAIAVPFWELKETLINVDVCICSSSCEHYLINKDLIEHVMTKREHRQLVLIDISMPRNIEPSVAAIGGVSLLAIDDLDKVVESTTQKRLEAVDQVEKIINNKVVEFFNVLEKRKSYINPTLERSTL